MCGDNGDIIICQEDSCIKISDEVDSAFQLKHWTETKELKLKNCYVYLQHQDFVKGIKKTWKSVKTKMKLDAKQFFWN